MSPSDDGSAEVETSRPTPPSPKPPIALSLLPPTLSRATSTSALSVISVESTIQTSPRRLLSASSRTRAPLLGISKVDVRDAEVGDVGVQTTPSSSRPVSLKGGLRAESVRSTPSRKGKERAIDFEDDMGVGGGGRGAAVGVLRKVVREDADQVDNTGSFVSTTNGELTELIIHCNRVLTDLQIQGMSYMLKVGHIFRQL